MELPFNMRSSTLKERKAFYEKFDINKPKKWMNRKLVYAMILGRHSNIVKDQYESDKNRPLIIDNYQNLKQVKEKIVQYLPEGVYYDRNYYKDISLCHDYNLKDAWEWHNFIGQELAFDIDPENVICPIHGSLQERMKKGIGLSFCKKAFQLSKEKTENLYDQLSQKYSKIDIIFSGRGFHIHVFDEETIYLNKNERRDIANTFKHYAIDRWVTTGEMRLIRLPYSLNGVSSRIVTPLSKSQLSDFNPHTQALPDFVND